MKIMVVPCAAGIRLNFRFRPFIYGLPLEHPLGKRVFIPFESHYLPLWDLNPEYESVFDAMLDKPNDLQRVWSPIPKNVVNCFCRHNYDSTPMFPNGFNFIRFKPFAYFREGDDYCFLNDTWRIRYHKKRFFKERINAPRFRELAISPHKRILGNDGKSLYIFDKDKFIQIPIQNASNIHYLRIREEYGGLGLYYATREYSLEREETRLWCNGDRVVEVSQRTYYTGSMFIAEQEILSTQLKAKIWLESEAGYEHNKGEIRLVCWLRFQTRWQQRRCRVDVIVPRWDIDRDDFINAILNIPNLREHIINNQPVFWETKL